MESGKHKKRINYTVMVVSDSPDGGIHPFYLEQRLVTAVLCLIILVLAVSVGTALHHSAALKKVREQDEQLQKQIEQLTQEKQELTTANEELSDKVTILSDTVAQNAEIQEAQAKEEEEKRIPNGFPLAGPAVILVSSETAGNAADAETQEAEAAAAEDGNADEETAEAAEKEPIVVFGASEGTKVIAAASGVIASVEDDAVYGHRITIDHGNGYLSIYRAASDPRVSEGDEVEAGTTLYEMQLPDEKLGYQIKQEGTLIDPLDLLEVYG